MNCEMSVCQTIEWAWAWVWPLLEVIRWCGGHRRRRCQERWHRIGRRDGWERSFQIQAWEGRRKQTFPCIPVPAPTPPALVIPTSFFPLSPFSLFHFTLLTIRWIHRQIDKSTHTHKTPSVLEHTKSTFEWQATRVEKGNDRMIGKRLKNFLGGFWVTHPQTKLVF